MLREPWTTAYTLYDRCGKSDAHVSVRWLIQRETVVVIPDAVTPKHVATNPGGFDFELSDREMQRIRKISAVSSMIAETYTLLRR